MSNVLLFVFSPQRHQGTKEHKGFADRRFLCAPWCLGAFVALRQKHFLHAGNATLVHSRVAFNLKANHNQTRSRMGLLDGLMGHASEVSFEKIAQEFEPLLIGGEKIEKAFRLIRDMFIFTNKRLILVEKQGMTGSKVDYQTIPYASIKKFSKESAGLLDLDAELKIWITGETTPLRKEFRKGDSINEVYRILSQYVLK